MSFTYSLFSVENSEEFLEDDLSTLEEALAAADGYLCDLWDGISIYENIWSSEDGKAYSLSEKKLLMTVYDTSAQREYDSPAAVAAREARAERIKQHNADLREAQLRRRPLVPGKPAWEERYDFVGCGPGTAGVYRLKPQFR